MAAYDARPLEGPLRPAMAEPDCMFVIKIVTPSVACSRALILSVVPAVQQGPVRCFWSCAKLRITAYISCTFLHRAAGYGSSQSDS